MIYVGGPLDGLRTKAAPPMRITVYLPMTTSDLPARYSITADGSMAYFTGYAVPLLHGECAP